MTRDASTLTSPFSFSKHGKVPGGHIHASRLGSKKELQLGTSQDSTRSYQLQSLLLTSACIPDCTMPHQELGNR